MIEPSRIVVLSAMVALLSVAGCQSGPTAQPTESSKPAESNKSTGSNQQTKSSKPTKSTEPEAAPVDTVEAAIDTLRTIETDHGAVKVIPLEHGSLILSWNEKVIYIDPTASALETISGEPPTADLVLVTHAHGDHLDPEAISQVRGEAASVIGPQSVADKTGETLPNTEIVANGKTALAFDSNLTIEAVPMYNLVRKQKNGEFYHPEGRGNAYILSMDGAKIYISGDTECTQEMKALRDIDAAFLSMNLPYTMPVDEAAECVRAFEPAVLYPYHYRGQDLSKLVGLLEDVTEVEVRLLEWYPGSEDSK
jgi:L-ascorbate metabolism protein UlaG (beta-lactamase superfamily)